MNDFAVATGFERTVVVSNASSIRFRFPNTNQVAINVIPCFFA
jgi:hypothetical protein